MKKISSILLTGLIFVLFLVSCEKTSGPVEPSLSDQGDNNILAKSPSISNIWADYNETEYIDCANNGMGEEIEFSGKIHTITFVTLDQNGGYHMTYRTNNAAVSGIGQMTGNRYMFVGAASENEVFGNVGQVYTNIVHFQIVSPSDMLKFDMIQHFVIHPDGTVTGEIARIKYICK